MGAITNATNASPIVVTASTAHGLSTGNRVEVSNVGGNTAANGTWTITVLSSSTFSLDDSSGNGAYTSGGTFARARTGRSRGRVVRDDLMVLDGIIAKQVASTPIGQLYKVTVSVDDQHVPVLCRSVDWTAAVTVEVAEGDFRGADLRNVSFRPAQLRADDRSGSSHLSWRFRVPS